MLIFCWFLEKNCGIIQVGRKSASGEQKKETKILQVLHLMCKAFLMYASSNSALSKTKCSIGAYMHLFLSILFIDTKQIKHM